MAGYVSTEDLLIDYLKTTLGYVNVSTELPTNLVDLSRSNPVIIVERFGGSDSAITLDVARVDVDVYANSRAAARLHAETIRAALRTRLRGHTYNGTAVGKIETIGAPTAAPYDSKHAVRRMTASYQLTLHNYVGVS